MKRRKPFADGGYVSVFSICRNLDIMTAPEALAAPEPAVEQLWGPWWCRGEICVFFSESNVGKSIVAMQVARDIARGINSITGEPLPHGPEKVLYIDYELQLKQFQSRYGGAELPASLHRATARVTALSDSDLDTAFSDIIAAMISGYKVVIVDNLTFLSDQIANPAKALDLMKRLKESALQYQTSLMLICHTPKRNPRQPLGKSDIAGSSNIINFADSAFTIGQSYLNPDWRYLKQIKVREGEFTYPADNVLVGCFEKTDNFLQFKPVINQNERLHLM